MRIKIYRRLYLLIIINPPKKSFMALRNVELSPSHPQPLDKKKILQ